MNELELSILDVLRQIYQTNDLKIDHRLTGGMSNYTYVVVVNNAKKVIRIPGKKAEYFVDRSVELANLKIIESITSNPKTEYFNIQTGIKITPYVEGISLHMTDDFTLSAIAKILKHLHQQKAIAANDYDPVKRLNQYEGYAISAGNPLTDAYLETKMRFLSHLDYLNSFEKVLCHGDAQRSNFIKKNDGTIILVDYEFCGNNDPFYDIACFGNREIDLGFKLLDVYLGKKANNEEIKHFLLWHAFQALQWYNVALYKHKIGLSLELGFDFAVIAEKYLKTAQSSLTRIK